jgi:hypothetical protein
MNFLFNGLDVGLLLTFLIYKKIQNQDYRQKEYTSQKKNTSDGEFHED